MSSDSNATGHCLCGGVKITLTAEHKEVGACHCSMCRRWTGGPFLAIEVGKDIEIDGKENVATYRSSDWAERGFCSKCGTNLYYRLVEAGDLFLAAGILDDQSGMALTGQVFIDEKPDFYEFANETKKFTGAEIFAMFAPPADSN